MHPGKQSKRRDLRPQTISFFDLPPEIRNKIYEYSILCPNLKKTKVNCGSADSEFSDPDFLETESNGIGYVKSWRGSTKVLRISRQTYMESHGYVHDTRGLIKVIPGSNRPDFPSATEPFLAAHNWKNSHLSLRPKWGIAELSQGTTYQFRRLVNLDLDLAYCVYMSATEEASLISRLARAYYCIEANTTLQTLTIKFKRYGQAAHSQAALVPIMLVIMTSLEPFITLRGNHLSIRAANRKLRPHREGVVDPYGDESLVTWFNKAREEWVQGIRASLATTDLIPDSTAAIDSPSQRKGGSGRNKYNPFAGQEKYIAKLELKRSTREATALRESESMLEDIHRMYQDEYVRPLYCRKHDDCGFSTSSRKELRRHKRLKEVPSHICGFDCNCFDRTNTFRCTWCYKLQDRKDYMGWVSHVNQCQLESNVVVEKTAEEVDWDIESLFTSSAIDDGDLLGGKE